MSKEVPAFAVIIHAPIRCPSTDGIMGEGECVVARFLTKSEADAYCAKADADPDDFYHRVEVRPYREGEDVFPRPMYSLPELEADARASAENCPDWAK
jgi:radical SAM superfamily enzyme